MYSFDELSDTSSGPFCYLLGVLKKWPPPKKCVPDFFTGEFGWLLNVEDQSTSPWQTRKRCELTKKYIFPTAPLSMTPSWSPFPLAFEVMKKSLQYAKDQEPPASAYAIFEPELKVGQTGVLSWGDKSILMETAINDSDIHLENIHAQHFMWLLDMTVARAKKMKKPVVLAGLPGFGYENQLDHDMNGENKLRLIEAGYLYPSRVPQGARYAFLSDPVARSNRADFLKLLSESTEGIPPPPCA